MDDGVTLNALIYKSIGLARRELATGSSPVIVTDVRYGTVNDPALCQCDTLLHSPPAGLDPVGGGAEGPPALLADADGWGEACWLSVAVSRS